MEVDAAIGDSLMATPALRAHRLRRPSVEIVLVAPWDSLTETVLRGNPSVGRFMPKDLALAARRPGDEWTTLSLWDALQWGAAHREPTMDGFAERLGVEIAGPQGYRLDLVLTEKERAAGTALRATLGPRERAVVCARHSPS